jgi:phosphohistidine phosphatase
MKTLLLLRHAKSSWSDSSLSDFDRPLNDRGRTTAPFMGEMMAKRDLIPEIIFSSPAVRATETAKLVLGSAGVDLPLVFEDGIYEASPQTLKHLATKIDPRYGSAMFVGHNPGMEGFIRLLTGLEEPMPTASLAVIGLEIETWSDVAKGKLIEVIRPKDVKRTANA